MSEQGPKDAPVGAGLGEQDAYGRGGGVTAEPIIVKAVSNASLSGGRLEGLGVKAFVVQLEAMGIGVEFVESRGGKSAEGIDFKDTTIERWVIGSGNVSVSGKIPTLPSRATVADSLLIFVTTDPDAAEVLVGDLLEKMARVRARKSASLTWCWFWWQVFWITVHQGFARIKDKTVLGKLGEAIIKRVGG